MKKVILFLVFLVFFKSIESAEQSKPSVNQEPVQAAFCYETWDGWAWDPTTDLWVNMKTGRVETENPRVKKERIHESRKNNLSS